MVYILPAMQELLLSHFSRVWLYATPEMAAHQAPPSLGFSRQEHWSGLPFTAPAWKWKVKVMLLSRVWLLATPWAAAHQAPPSMGFSRQEYGSGVPLLSPAMQETRIQSLNQEDPLEKGMATHSSFLAWKMPWTEEPSRLHSMGLQRVRYNWATNTLTFLERRNIS